MSISPGCAKSWPFAPGDVSIRTEAGTGYCLRMSSEQERLPLVASSVVT